MDQPLAERLRPRNLDEFLGQNKILGEQSLLRKSLENDNVPSMIFWGPPGCGKTSLAHVIRQHTKKAFVALSAILTAILCFDVDVFGVLAARSDAAYPVIGGWSLEPHHLQIAVTRLLYPFFAGLLISRFKWSVTLRRGGFAATAFIIAIVLAMPYFAPASMPWVNGLYETFAILIVFPFVVMMGAGSNEGGRLCRFLGEISYPLYVTHYPLVYVQMSWMAAHPNLPAATHAAVGVSLFILTIAIAYASLKLYDIPVRRWLANRNNKLELTK